MGGSDTVRQVRIVIQASLPVNAAERLTQLLLYAN
jgi:hypothetical protein